MSARPRAPRSTLALMIFGIILEAVGLLADHQQLALGAMWVGGAVILASGGAWLLTRYKPSGRARQTTLAPANPELSENATAELPENSETPPGREWLPQPYGAWLRSLDGLTQIQIKKTLRQGPLEQWTQVSATVLNVAEHYGYVTVYGRLDDAGVLGVELTFRERDAATVARLTVGATLTAVGQVSSWNPGSLVHCELVRYTNQGEDSPHTASN